MNKNILEEEIRSLLDDIREQYDAILSMAEPVPQIEFDMLLENIRKLYQNLHMLQKVNDPYEFLDHQPKNVPPLPENPPQPVPEPGFTPVAETPVKEPKKKTEDKSPDLFTPGPGTDFLEKLKEAREQTLGPRPASPEPKELRSMISINDKFLFINELFDGNLRDYNENIDTLSGFNSKDQAMDYLDRLRNKNYWESTGKAFLRLQEILVKRFG
ncbi:MAG: hypothetical protein Q8867_04485 [Bacteroidota bacterium]|nr:hypothetical protein [Bacteroidota bacterium]